jgi:hypothetical protein
MIDSIEPFKRLLSETHLSGVELVGLVKQFLGSMGGMSHMIVSDIVDEDVVAWDYESPMSFPIPLGGKKFDLRLG